MSEIRAAESAELDAFVIRGHHATRLYNVLAMGMSIDDTIKAAEKSPSPYPGYKKDVWGTTLEQADTVTEVTRQFISDFLNLPDEAKVRFVAGQKDAICNSCAIGKHCETTSPKGDAHFLKTISRLAHEIGAEEVLVETEVTLEGWSAPSPILELPAWAAKLILSDLDFHAQTYPKLFRPLTRALVRHTTRATR